MYEGQKESATLTNVPLMPITNIPGFKAAMRNLLDAGKVSRLLDPTPATGVRIDAKKVILSDMTEIYSQGYSPTFSNPLRANNVLSSQQGAITAVPKYTTLRLSGKVRYSKPLGTGQEEDEAKSSQPQSCEIGPKETVVHESDAIQLDYEVNDKFDEGLVSDVLDCTMTSYEVPPDNSGLSPFEVILDMEGVNVGVIGAVTNNTSVLLINDASVESHRQLLGQFTSFGNSAGGGSGDGNGNLVADVIELQKRKGGEEDSDEKIKSTVRVQLTPLPEPTRAKQSTISMLFGRAVDVEKVEDIFSSDITSAAARSDHSQNRRTVEAHQGLDDAFVTMQALFDTEASTADLIVVDSVTGGANDVDVGVAIMNASSEPRVPLRDGGEAHSDVALLNPVGDASVAVQSMPITPPPKLSAASSPKSSSSNRRVTFDSAVAEPKEAEPSQPERGKVISAVTLPELSDVITQGTEATAVQSTAPRRASLLLAPQRDDARRDSMLAAARAAAAQMPTVAATSAPPAASATSPPGSAAALVAARRASLQAPLAAGSVGTTSQDGVCATPAAPAGSVSAPHRASVSAGTVATTAQADPPSWGRPKPIITSSLAPAQKAAVEGETAEGSTPSSSS
ncbi:hypothetical protein EON64_13920, partial [archaeon]